MYNHHHGYSSNHHYKSEGSATSNSNSGAAVVISQKTWNGTAWVEDNPVAETSASAVPPPPPDLDLPAAPPHMTDLDPTTATLSQLITQYSHYYQYWSTQATEIRQQLNNNNNNDNEEIHRRAVWAEYYADRSSRLAHYYLNFQQQPPPQPIAAKQEQVPVHNINPAIATDNDKVVARKSRWGAKQQPPQESQEKDAPPPASLQRFAHANLSTCQTHQEKELVQKQLEIIIRTSIQDGNMHTKNWDMEPKIIISSPSQPKINNHPDHNNNNNNINKRSYANAVMTIETPKKKKNSNNHPNTIHNFQNSKKYSKNFGDNYDDQLLTNDSYYGNNNNSFSSLDAVNTDNYNNNNNQDPTTGVAPDFISLSNNSSFASPYSSSTAKNMCYNKNNYNANNQHSSKNKSIHKKYRRASTTSSNDNNNLDEVGLDHSHSTLAKRADRFKGKGGNSTSIASSLHNVGKYMGKGVIGGLSSNGNKELDYEQMTVKGTCQVLEKKYLRLTAPPRADLVRPQPILQQHLNNLKTKYYSDENIHHGKENSSKTDDKNNNSSVERYNWFCSQFKALRQDLTVQRIFNALSVDVYETHARIALEQGDLNEYNQCQTQLKELYELLLHGHTNNKTRSKVEVCEGLKHQNEFIAYRLIYHVFLTGNKKYDGGSSDLFKIMLDLTPQQKQDPAIVHALQVRSAFADFDYHAFFKLKEMCPNLSCHLMEYMVPQVRFFALQRILKSYRPTVDLQFVLTELGLNNNNDIQNQENDAHNNSFVWLQSTGVKFSSDGQMILCKESFLQESQVQNSLI